MNEIPCIPGMRHLTAEEAAWLSKLLTTHHGRLQFRAFLAQASSAKGGWCPHVLSAINQSLAFPVPGAWLN